jgi:hypothetical protein
MFKRTVICVPFAANHLSASQMLSREPEAKKDALKHAVGCRSDVEQFCVQHRIAPPQLRQFELRHHFASFCVAMHSESDTALVRESDTY